MARPGVWDHITGLFADPALIHVEIDQRLAQLRTADSATTPDQQRVLRLLVKDVITLVPRSVRRRQVGQVSPAGF